MRGSEEQLLLLLAIEQVRATSSSLSAAVRKPETRIQNPNSESLSSFSMAVAFQLQHEPGVGPGPVTGTTTERSEEGGGRRESDWDNI